jgi:hypothetical protein
MIPPDLYIHQDIPQRYDRGESLREAISLSCKFDSLATAWLPEYCRGTYLLPNSTWHETAQMGLGDITQTSFARQRLILLESHEYVVPFYGITTDPCTTVLERATVHEQCLRLFMVVTSKWQYYSWSTRPIFHRDNQVF